MAVTCGDVADTVPQGDIALPVAVATDCYYGAIGLESDDAAPAAMALISLQPPTSLQPALLTPTATTVPSDLRATVVFSPAAMAMTSVMPVVIHHARVLSPAATTVPWI